MTVFAASSSMGFDGVAKDLVSRSSSYRYIDPEH